MMDQATVHAHDPILTSRYAAYPHLFDKNNKHKKLLTWTDGSGNPANDKNTETK